MNHELEATIEAWNYANIELDRIDTDLVSNAKHLTAARKSLGHRAAAHPGAPPRPLRQRRGRLDARGDPRLVEPRRHHRAARRDRARLEPGHADPADGQAYRKEVETRRENLQEARADQARIVEEQAAKRQAIESQISEQNRLLASVKDEIAEMRAEEQRRQAALADQARARAAGGPARCGGEPRSRPTTPRLWFQTYDPNASGPRATATSSRIALQYLGVPVRLGRVQPVDRLRLLRASSSTYSRRSAFRFRTTPRRSTTWERPCLRADRRRRPRLLQWPRARRHRDRRRPVRARAAHRRRRQDLQPLRTLRLVRRRPPALVRALSPRARRA